MIGKRCLVSLLLLVILSLSLGAVHAQPPPPADLSDLRWSEAFDRLHAALTTSYAFGDHKQIDWDALYAAIQPRIAAAEPAVDYEAYYLALREYVAAVPDGLVSIDGDPGRLFDTIAGGYGLTLADLDDGRVVADRVLPGRAAEAAGIQPGAVILAWDEAPIETALAAAPVTWSEVNPATTEGRRLQQLRWLVRAPAGTPAAVTYQNPGAAEPVTATLAAEVDGFLTLGLTYVRFESDELLSPVTFDMRPDGYGYLRLTTLAPLAVMYAGVPQEQVDRAVMEAFDVPLIRALLLLGENAAAGLVIDLRGNAGGLDTLAATIAGYLVGPEYYAGFSIYDTASGAFVPGSAEAGTELTIRRQVPHFDGPVVVLVDGWTQGAAERLAQVIGARDQAAVVGFTGTHGSFGYAGGAVLLPGRILVQYPVGRATDAGGELLIASDGDAGGVLPTVRVPRTVETVLSAAAGVDVALAVAIDTLDAMQQ